jgi:PAS domain S-box-containing protein
MKSLEELQAENRVLRENNEALLALIRNAPAALIALTPDGIVRLWNPAAESIFGWEAEEVIGHRNPIVPEEKSQEFENRHHQVVKGDTLIGHEVRRKRKDGEAIDVSISTATIKDEQGQVERIVGVLLDISKRKAAEREILELNASLEEKVAQRTAELSEAIKDLESFSYSVSHDLRSPLRAIDGYSNILLEDYEDTLDEDGHHLLKLVIRNTQRMSQLIDDLLAFSRMGRTPIKKVPTDLKALAADVFLELQEAHPDRQTVFEISSGIPITEVDPSVFRQVLVNLLSNAFKFTRHRQPGHIEFGAEPDGEFTKFWVKDDGAGFDMAHIERLFGVFQRLHRESEFEGTGVGLAIVAKIINRHGGRIEACGEVDKGATFTFWLPNL